MNKEIKTNEFHLEYTESLISQPILWESHCHTQYEIIAVEDGDVTIMLEGQKYRLKKNQIIIIPPLFYHSITANEKGCYRRITILFGIESIPNVLQPEFIKQKESISITSFDVEKIKSLCYKENPLYYVPMIQSLMVQIFYDALQAAKDSTRIETDTFLQQACQYIEQHLHEKILLDDLAKYTAKSKSSFCHLFKEKMNISPKQYILQKRLAVASKLIDEGTPHTVAAMQVGYENYSNFYKLYRTHLKNTKYKN